MNYNVNGLTFSHEELNSTFTLPVEGEVSGSYYFFIPVNSAHIFTLIKPGQYISSDALEKIAGKNIYCLNIADSNILTHFKELSTDLSRSVDEYERLLCGKKFIGDLFGSLEGSYASNVSVVKAAFDNFYELNPKIAYLLDQKSETLFQRSLTVAGFAVIYCTKSGIVDFEFLKRIYNIMFCLDIGLVLDGELSSNILHACELERKRSGDGQKFIKNLSKKEADIFHAHPKRGMDFLKRILQTDEYISLIDIVYTHHEKDSIGFPRGISSLDLTHFEQIIIDCDQSVPFTESLLESYFIIDLLNIEITQKEVA